jgi:hypothetical protein
MEEEFGKITEDDQKQISQYSELKLSIKKIRTNANKVMPTNSKVDKRLLYYSENLEPFGTLPGIYLMLDLDEKTKKDYYAKLKEFSKFPKEIVEAVSLKKKLSECEKDLAYKKRELMEKEIYYYSIASLLNNSRINEKEEERLNNFIESFIIDGWVLKSITPIVSGAFDIHYGGGTLTEFGGKVSTGGGYGYSYTDGVLLHFEK